MPSVNYNYDLLVITGPTACGKTSLSASLACRYNGEIISADSRQVYRKMDIGTGKDLDEYIVSGKTIPYHLIDIVDPGEKYNVFAYQSDFLNAYEEIVSRHRLPVVCGGSGMYIDSIVSGYRMMEVPPNPQLREVLERKSMQELTAILSSFKQLHNSTDIDSKKRVIRAIEIEYFQQKEENRQKPFPKLKSLVIGLMVDRDVRRSRISLRLRERLDAGLVDEVRNLLDEGLTKEDLIYYGLEYKYVTLYLTGELPYNDMVKQLETAIHQFAKRQMTWFRGMERRGTLIHWIDYNLSLEEKMKKIDKLLLADDCR